MKRAATILATVLLQTAAANAMPSFHNMQMSCDQVRAAIRENGSVLLRWPSQRVANLPRFGKYVYTAYYCEQDEVTKFASVPSADNPNCPVLECQLRLGDDHDKILIPG